MVWPAGGGGPGRLGLGVRVFRVEWPERLAG